MGHFTQLPLKESDNLEGEPKEKQDDSGVDTFLDVADTLKAHRMSLLHAVCPGEDCLRRYPLCRRPAVPPIRYDTIPLYPPLGFRVRVRVRISVRVRVRVRMRVRVGLE